MEYWFCLSGLTQTFRATIVFIAFLSIKQNFRRLSFVPPATISTLLQSRRYFRFWLELAGAYGFRHRGGQGYSMLAGCVCCVYLQKFYPSSLECFHARIYPSSSFSQQASGRTTLHFLHWLPSMEFSTRDYEEQGKMGRRTDKDGKAACSLLLCEV